MSPGRKRYSLSGETERKEEKMRKMRVDSVTLMNALRCMMEENGILGYCEYQKKKIDKRKSGGGFTMDEHIEGLIFSLLSSRCKWENIERNDDKIREIFLGFSGNKIKERDPSCFVAKLEEIGCENPSIKRQMDALNYDIEVFERIEIDFGSIDAFLSQQGKAPPKIAELLSDLSFHFSDDGDS
jgi:hypothetical protein